MGTKMRTVDKKTFLACAAFGGLFYIADSVMDYFSLLSRPWAYGTSSHRNSGA